MQIHSNHTIIVLMLGSIPALAFGQVPVEPTQHQPTQHQPTDDQIAAFAEQMTGATLVGRYTDGSDESKTERYEIKQAKKLERSDLWIFNARIVYGETDVTLPVPLQVKWAGKTPVITMDDTTIPGLGTVSAHVVIDGNRYAGTWSHDNHGGHLFGMIEVGDAATSGIDAGKE